MIDKLEQAPNLLQVIIKVPSYNQDGRRYYTNMNVPKEKVEQIINLIEGVTDKVTTVKKEEKISVKTEKKSPKNKDKKPQIADKQIKSED